MVKAKLFASAKSAHASITNWASGRRVPTETALVTLYVLLIERREAFREADAFMKSLDPWLNKVL